MQVFSGTGPVARKLVDAVRSIERSFSVTLRDMSPENLALFVGATAVEDVADAANLVTDEALTVKQGRWYQLGVKDAKPTGVGAIDATATKTVVTDTDKTSPTTYAADDDYKVDAARGRIYIVADGDIAHDADLLIDYTPIAGTRKQVKTGELKEVRAALRYIETPVSGEPRHYYAPLCTVSAGGELGLMSRDTEQQIQLTAAI